MNNSQNQNSFAYELMRQLGRGAVVELPKSIGQATRAFSIEGTTPDKLGKQMVESAEKRDVEWQPDLKNRNFMEKQAFDAAAALPRHLATALFYLGGPVAGAAATAALHGGKGFQEAEEQSTARGRTGMRRAADSIAGGLMGNFEAQLVNIPLLQGTRGLIKRLPSAYELKSAYHAAKNATPFAKAFAKGALNSAELARRRGIAQLINKYGLTTKDYNKFVANKATIDDVLRTIASQGSIKALPKL